MTSRTLLDTATPPDRGFLIQIIPPHRDREYAELLAAELDHLARGAGLEVVGSRLYSARRAIPATYLGSGSVTELAAEIQACNAAVVVFNNPLSAVQQRDGWVSSQSGDSGLGAGAGAGSDPDHCVYGGCDRGEPAEWCSGGHG